MMDDTNKVHEAISLLVRAEVDAELAGELARIDATEVEADKASERVNTLEQTKP